MKNIKLLALSLLTVFACTMFGAEPVRAIESEPEIIPWTVDVDNQVAPAKTVFARESIRARVTDAGNNFVGFLMVAGPHKYKCIVQFSKTKEAVCTNFKAVGKYSYAIVVRISDQKYVGGDLIVK